MTTEEPEPSNADQKDIPEDEYLSNNFKSKLAWRINMRLPNSQIYRAKKKLQESEGVGQIQ